MLIGTGTRGGFFTYYSTINFQLKKGRNGHAIVLVVLLVLDKSTNDTCVNRSRRTTKKVDSG